MEKTLMLFIDAFSFSDFNKENTPNLWKLVKDNVYGRLKTVPAGYHIEYSMLSGCLPLKHNVWAWYYMNPKGSFSKIKYVRALIKVLEKFNKERFFIDIYINLIRLFSGKTRFLKSNKIPIDTLEKFDVSVDKMHFEHNPLPVPTLFDVLRKNNIKYVGMEFPVISDHKKTGFYFKKGDFDQIDKAEKLLGKYDIVYLHVWKLDALEHKYGLHSKDALMYLKEIDKKIGNIIKKNPGLRLIVFSDHGGVNVKKTINVMPILDDFECDYFIGSTTVQVWLKNPSDIKKKELKDRFEKKGLLVYDENNIEKELFIPYRRNYVGDMIVWVKPGEQFFPDFFRKNARVKSMHGYSVKVPELDGIFIMGGFGTKKKIEGMNLYDIAPTVLKGLGIKPPSIWDGKSGI